MTIFMGMAMEIRNASSYYGSSSLEKSGLMGRRRMGPQFAATVLAINR